MKKIPTLFKREFQNHIVVSVSPDLSDETLSWVLDGEGEATVKIDGACCAFIDGVFYKRYDAKKNKKGIMKKPPEGSIPCDEPDPVTGHWPHWEPVREEDPGAKWYLAAYENAIASGVEITEGTYEAIGPHFQNNPYHLGILSMKETGCWKAAANSIIVRAAISLCIVHFEMFLF